MLAGPDATGGWQQDGTGKCLSEQLGLQVKAEGLGDGRGGRVGCPVGGMGNGTDGGRCVDGDMEDDYLLAFQLLGELGCQVFLGIGNGQLFLFQGKREMDPTGQLVVAQQCSQEGFGSVVQPLAKLVCGDGKRLAGTAFAELVLDKSFQTALGEG